VRVGLAELPSSQVLFATDYPQAVRQDDEVIAYVKAVGGLGSGARKILDGANAEKLIPNLKEPELLAAAFGGCLTAHQPCCCGGSTMNTRS
jgi:hypothetical protein